MVVSPETNEGPGTQEDPGTKASGPRVACDGRLQVRGDDVPKTNDYCGCDPKATVARLVSRYKKAWQGGGVLGRGYAVVRGRFDHNDVCRFDDV